MEGLNFCVPVLSLINLNIILFTHSPSAQDVIRQTGNFKKYNKSSTILNLQLLLAEILLRRLVLLRNTCHITRSWKNKRTFYKNLPTLPRKTFFQRTAFIRSRGLNYIKCLISFLKSANTVNINISSFICQKVKNNYVFHNDNRYFKHLQTNHLFISRY